VHRTRRHNCRFKQYRDRVYNFGKDLSGHDKNDCALTHHHLPKGLYATDLRRLLEAIRRLDHLSKAGVIARIVTVLGRNMTERFKIEQCKLPQVVVQLANANTSNNDFKE
jgi:hypothetical protein